MTEKNLGPARSEAQKIGNDADAALNAHKPERWHMGRAAGDDFGYDYTVTAWGTEETQGAQYAFNIQLKGTTQAKARIDGGKALSHSFNRTTLTLWSNSGTAVVVAIADLIDSRDPLEAAVYYKLVNDEIDDVIDELSDDQRSLTIQVPLHNVVHRHLDIVPELAAYQEGVRLARRLLKKARAASGSLEEVSSLLEASTKGATVGFSEGSAGEEIETLIGMCGRAQDLGVALTLLKAGSYERALEALDSTMVPAAPGQELETGIAAYIRYRALAAVGAKDDAGAALMQAFSLAPQSDEISASHYQGILDRADLGPDGKGDRQKLLAEIAEDCGPNVMVIRAKVLSLDGSFDEARSCLQSLPKSKSIVPSIIVSIVERNWERAIIEAEEAKADSLLPDRQRLWILVLEARAHFQSSLRRVPQTEDALLYIPSTGLPEMDVDALRSAHASARQALVLAQRLNWPSDMHHILDVVSVTTLILGLEESVLPLLISFVSTRPDVVEVREAVSKLLLQVGKPEAVLEILALHKSGPCFPHEELIGAVSAFKAGKLEKVFDYLNADSLSKEDDGEFYLSSLMMIGMAADAALRFDVLGRVRSRLSRSPASLPYLAILESGISVNSSLLEKGVVISRLYQFWQAAERPMVIAHHLLGNADESDPASAEMILEVAQHISTRSGMSSDDEAKVGRALLTLRRPAEAVSHLQNARKRFPSDSEIGSALGIALEAAGHSAEAFTLIGELLNEGAASDGARRFYVDIAVRFGFLVQAERQLRSLYAAATKREAKLRLLSTIFQILTAKNDSQAELEEIAWQFGSICEPQVEEEEASFLQMYLLSTMNAERPNGTERVTAFHRRIQQFTDRFPESKLFRPVRVPDNGGADQLLAALQDAIGSTPESRSRERAIFRRMNNGKLPVPFTWRPRRFLKDVSDIFMLWHVRKKLPPEDFAYHFQNSVADYDRASPVDIGNQRVVLSLCSLLLLNEIGLLELALENFREVVIARATIGALSEAKGPLGSGWGNGVASTILSKLQEHFHKIKHPGYWGEPSRQGLPAWHAEERHAASEPGSVYFCDDIYESIMVCGSRDGSSTLPSISVPDFLEWAQAKAGLLSKVECADALSQLLRLRIARVNISDEYLLAAIGQDLRSAHSRLTASTALESSTSLRGILDGVWTPLVPFAQLLEHLTRIFCRLLTENDCSDDALSALWLRWLQAVRFQDEPPLLPERKVAYAFLRLISQLPDEAAHVSRAWRIYWSVICDGLPASASAGPDKAAAQIVGEILGSDSADKMPSLNTGVAGDLLRKAKLGLIDGTDVYSSLDQAYLEAAVNRTRSLISSKL